MTHHAHVRSTVLPKVEDTAHAVGAGYRTILAAVADRVPPGTDPASVANAADSLAKATAAHLDWHHRIEWNAQASTATAYAATAAAGAEALQTTTAQLCALIGQMEVPDLWALTGTGDSAPPRLDPSAPLRVYTLEPVLGRHVQSVPDLSAAALGERFNREFPGSSPEALEAMLDDAVDRFGGAVRWNRAQGVAFAPAVSMLKASVEANFAWTARATGRWRTPEQIWLGSPFVASPAS